MACGKLSDDPFRGTDGWCKSATEGLLAEGGFVRDGREEHQAKVIDFELLGELARIRPRQAGLHSNDLGAGHS